MPEENKEEETQETQGTQGTEGTQGTPAPAPEPDGAPTAEELTAMKAELEEEKKAIAAAQASIQEKDALIAELQAKLDDANHASEAAAAELTQVKDAHSKAVAKYLEISRTANPTIPGDVIAGTTIDEIDASIAKALSIAGAVKANLEAQARETRVPAGAPPRTEIPLEGLSPREKIVAGITSLRGTQ